uniref:cysteine--tRNA ligase n=1 Tax=Scleropages formosus TaxID=113540 RepID=A0A8C9VKP7_SCLFO
MVGGLRAGCARLQVKKFGTILNGLFKNQVTLKTKSLYTRSDPFCCGPEKSWSKPAGQDTGLKVFNSLTKRKEPLILAKEGAASWYSCGPTVYDHAHLGHACSYVRFDILQRILSRVFGINVTHIMVITDIDDKIIQRSQKDNISATALAKIYEEEFKNDMSALKVLPPTLYMRVTENIPQIIAFIKGIINNGHAYATHEGHVYFDIRSIGNRYGKFTGMSVAAYEQGEGGKRDIRDFALWKASKPLEPYWESPWGRGRPGWHIECSTIASSVFGDQLDIHSGGIDLAFPHHENEIAQCEAYHKCDQWGNYFLHSGHLHLRGSTEKMSKSLKNYITIKDFLQSYSADEFRMFCLLSRYQSAVDYSDTSMAIARSLLQSISAFIHDAESYMKGQLLCQAVDEVALWQRLADTKASVQKALADDFDTPRAIDAVMSLIHHGNCQLQVISKANGSSRSAAPFGAIVSYIRDFLDVLGIDLLHSVDSPGLLENVVEELVRFRSEVRSIALAPQEVTPSNTKDGTPPGQPRRDRVPLLRACDALRKNLEPFGVHIKVTSLWTVGGNPRRHENMQTSHRLSGD